MANFKKSIASASLATIVASMVPANAFAATSMSFGTEFDTQALPWGYTNGLTSYNNVPDFAGDSTLTREQAAKFLVNWADVLGLNLASDTTRSCTFNDASTFDPSLASYVTTACQQGLFQGSNGSFWAKQPITRAEFFAVVIRALEGAKSDESMSPWWKEYFTKAMEYGLTNESDVYAQSRQLLRYEALLILYRTAMDNGSSTDCTLLGTCSTSSSSSVSTSVSSSSVSSSSVSSTSSSVVTDQGTLEVSVDANTPAARSVPRVGTVVAGKYDFVAGLSDVTLSSVRLSRDGLGDPKDIQKVWFEDNGMRVSTQAILNTTDNSVIVSFAPALVLKANSTKVLDLVTSLSGATAGSQHRFVIAAASDVNSTATESGSFPLFTNFMTTYNYAVANINVTSNTSLTGTYKVGDTNVDLGKFQVSNNSNEEKVGLLSVRLRADNSTFPTNVSNIAVYRGSTKVSSDVTFDGRYVNVKLSDDVKNTEGTVYYTVRGDITNVDTRTQETYQLTLDKADDLRAIERSTGFQAKINTTSPLVIGNFVIKGGDVILTRDASVALSQTVPQASLEISLAKGSIKTADAFTFDRLPISFANGDSSQFTQLRLYINGVAVSTIPGGSTVFEGPFTVNAGTNTFEVKAQTRDNITTGTYRLNTINSASFVNAESVINGAKLADRFVGVLDGSTVTVTNSSLTLSRNDGISNSNLIQGASNVTMVQFAANPGPSMDVVLNGMAFDVAGNVNTSLMGAATLYKDGTAIKTASVAGNVVRFDNLNMTLPKNSNSTFKVVVDSFSTAIPTSSTIQLNLQGANVDVQDTNGSRLTVTSNVTGPQYTFVSNGSVNVNAVSNNNTYLMTSTESYNLGNLDLSAVNAGSNIEYVFLKNNGTLQLSNAIASVNLVNGTTTIPGTIVGNNTIRFQPNVAIDTTKNSTWSVVATFNPATTVDRAGKTVQLTNGFASDVDQTQYPQTSNGIRAVSANGTISTVNGAFTTNTHQLQRSIPLLSVSGTDPYNFKVNVAAKGDNKITLNGLNLLRTSNVGNATYQLKYGSTVLKQGALSDLNGQSVLNFDTAGIDIANGTSVDLDLVITGDPAQNSTTQTTIRVVDAAYSDNLENGNVVQVTSVKNFTNVGANVSVTK